MASDQQVIGLLAGNIHWSMQVLAAAPTFQMAFAGKESELSEHLDVSTSGLLTKLLDGKIINRNQRQLVEVSVILFHVSFLQ